MTELKLSFTNEEQKKVDMLKRYYGIKSNTELIRFLISKNHRELPQD